MRIVELVKQFKINGDKSLLKQAFDKNACHFIRSMRAHLPLLYAETVTSFGPYESFFQYFYPERCLVKNCHCGNFLKFVGKERGYGTYCSTRCAGKSENVKQNRKETVRKNWGVDHVLQSPQVIDKVQKTNLELYGNICSAQGKIQSEIRLPQLRLKGKSTWEKACATVQKKFGVPSINHLQITKDSSKSAQIKIWQDEILPIKLKDLSENFKIECIKPPNSANADGSWKHYCGNSFSSPIKRAHICKVCHVAARSQPERELLDFVRTLDSYVISCDKSQLSPLEIDVYLPNKKLGMELNGVYWHRDGHGTPLSKKTSKASSIDIQIMHFWDYEWVNNRKIVESIVKSRLQKSETNLLADDLTIDLNIQLEEAISFCRDNHFLKFCDTDNRIGLKLNGKLVALVLANESKSKIDVFRYIKLLDTEIIGGIDRIYKNANKPISLLEDLRFSQPQIGSKIINPSVLWARGRKILSKHDFSNLEDKTGWVKHLDCGTQWQKYSRETND